MAEFVEVMKLRKKICETSGNCPDCVMSSYNNGKTMECNLFLREHPQEAEEIIMQWAKEHPAKTNADKAREIFGDKVPFTFKLGNSCGGINCPDHHDCCKCDYANFWDSEYKEPSEEASNGEQQE